MKSERRSKRLAGWALALAAVGLFAAPRRVAADAPPPPPTASAAGSASAPPAADPAVQAALRALAECDGKRLTDDCSARDAWSARAKLLRDLDEENPEGKAKRAGAASACVLDLRHASRSVREAAAECVYHHADHVADRTGAAQALIAQLAVERFETVRREQLHALRPLNPTQLGLAGRVVALARPLVGKRAAERELRELVRALEPSYFGPEIDPAPEAVAFALELLKRRVAVSEAVGVLGKLKAPSEQVCEALLDVASTKRGEWAEALHELAGDEGRCQAQRARAVDLVAEAAVRPGSPSRKHGFSEAGRSLARFAMDAGLSPEQKAKLREAVAAAEKNGSDPKKLEPLRAALGTK